MQPHPDREVLKLLTECSPFNLEAKKFFDPNALRLAVAPSNREDCKDCDSAEKPYECFDEAQHERKISNDFTRSSVRPEALEG